MPVVDLTAGSGKVPRGAWVRVRSTADAPKGDGGILAADGPAVPGRECWREATEAVPVPEGYAGLVLRGLGSAGRAGDLDVRALAAKVAGRVLLDWPHPPDEAAPPVEGLVLADVLFACVDPPARLAARLERIGTGDLRRVKGQNFVSSPGSPAARRIAGGEAVETVAGGWFGGDDAFEHAWPGGAGLLHAVALRRKHGGLEGVIRAYAHVPALVTAPPSPPPAPVEVEEVVQFDLNEPVAIVGMGCRLPGGAATPEKLWELLTSGFDAIVEVPISRWDPALFWDADRSVPDKTYAKIGGFVTDFAFNPRRFRIPPSVARVVDPIQQMALEAAADALEDAGLGANREWDRERAAVILGNSMGGEIGDDYTLRVMFPALRKALNEVPGFAALPDIKRAQILVTYEELVKHNLPPITEDSMPGELSNVVAGRIANALNLGGPNYTTDAACAGSMAAVQAAVKGLQDGDFDVAITGGADRSMGVATYTKFCKIGALSPDGSRPFDADANGFVMGEGVGILVLKRLSDAERDDDRVYAVIRSVGASSDGKGKGITAPNPEGQKRALVRAYESAGIDPVDVDLFECHGTSTVVGDKVEVEALTDIVGRGRRGDRGPARIGSIKSNIGHLKSAAGAAAAIKSALAIHKQVLPPQINYRKPRKDIDLGGVPLKVQTEAEAWTTDRLRRAGISAFGFGGTNFHMVLEEYRKGQYVRRAPHPQPLSPQAGRGEQSVAAPSTQASEEKPLSPAGGEGGRRPGEGSPPLAAIVPPRPVSAGSVEVPEGLWALSADSPEELIAKCRALRNGRPTPYEPDAPLRVAACAVDDAERDAQIEKVIAALQKGKGFDLLRQRGINVEDVPCDGQLAFLFTGQGSQYIDMGLDLAEKYPIVAETFREADRVMTPLLGRPLTDFVRRDPSLPEEDQFERLRATEISQPATLMVDVAILRLLAAWGVYPDMVAGHSLGEYGAAVAAGMLSFQDALLAVSARGREMASVKLDDFGKMAGIATNVETVSEVLAEIPGYVVAANKNCPTQTVIAGETEAVEAAIEAFKSRGITVYPLPVSHAFHSRIVAPASEPLKRVLEKLDLKEPRRRISTNVDSRWYPTGPGAREKIIDIMAKQVASPVEWISQIERMYGEGARIFVECGPKRALAGFVVSILKHRPHRSYYTNQPKRGGVASFLDALAGLFALGFPVVARPGREADLFGTPGPRRSTSPKLGARQQSRAGDDHGTPAVEVEILKIVAAKTGYPVDALDLDFDLEADLGIDTVKLADVVATVRDRFRLEHDPSFRMGEYRTLRALIDYAGRRIGATRPAAVPERRAAQAEEAPGLPADVAASFLAQIATKDIGSLDARAFAEAMLPALQGFLQASWQAFAAARPPVVLDTPHPQPLSPRAGRGEPSGPMPSSVVASTVLAAPMSIVCSGASLGLPGGDEVFAADNVRRMLAGENRIAPVPADRQDQQLQKGVLRLVKNPRTGQGEFVRVEERDGVIRLAGQKAKFDLVGDYGIDPALARSLDVTTQLAFAAGLEALRDAGIPLVRTFRATSTGKSVATGWALPAEMRDGTGIVFASAFPGYDQLVRKLKAGGDDGEGNFDRRFLFQILAMGHSQFAQLVGARGPNTQVNAACASTTQAVSIAEDWIRCGRCERVIVLGADDVTNEQLMEWIGSGFLAAGAATTEADVTKAALPFDRRRHGMILGMGAVALVIEKEEAVRGRGMTPIAKLLGTRISNSAFHGTRLDADHISREVSAFADGVVRAAGVDKARFAEQCVFLSHETYTPARGGSAAAEMASLPAAFGPAAKKIVIANTKGFTGHPMGAGIEDTVAVKALQYQEVPPIANLEEPDPDLGELTLSKGGHYDVRYALRLAAGFGSQLALSAWEKQAHGDTRVTHPEVYQSWLAAMGSGKLVVENRQLRWVVDEAAVAGTPHPQPLSPQAGRGEQSAAGRGEQSAAGRGEQSAAGRGEQSAAGRGEEARETTQHVSTRETSQHVSREDVLKTLIAVVAQKTGYDPSEVDPSYELEADLGIDTVKQAEIFGEVRAKYGLARDDSFRLADYPTIEKLAGWMAEKAAEGAGPDAGADAPHPASGHPLPASGERGNPSEKPEPLRVQVAAEAPKAAAAPSRDEVLQTLLAVVAQKTGYEVAELDPSFELEADLGIDTVKQAEIFGEVRTKFGLARDDSFRLADYPTIEKLAGWMAEKVAEGAPAAPAVEPPAEEDTTDLPSDVRRAAEPPEPHRLSRVEGTDAFLVEPTDEAPLTAPPPPVRLDLQRASPKPGSRLPASFRIRRPVWVERSPGAHGSVKGRVVWVLGDGPLADALRGAIKAAGATPDGHPDAVIDVGLPVLEAFAQARALDANPPAQWICVVQPAMDMRGARDAGARAGLAKALGREWAFCHGRVVDLSVDLEPEEAAAALLQELSENDRAQEIFLGTGWREVAVLANEPFPPPGKLLGSPVVLLTGGTRGITARVAMHFASQGPCTLVLVGRTAPGAAPLDEDKEKKAAKKRLEAAGERATPKKIEDQLKPLRTAEEVRKTVEALEDEGATVEVHALDLADDAAVRRLVADVVAKHGRIDVAVHGAGVEESRLLADKDEAAFRRVYAGKAEGGLALAEALPAETVLVSMGSIAGRLGNPGQTDYTAANEAMARTCLRRPNSLHICWTAWADVGMAVRGGMESLLTGRGVELLPADAGAELVGDLVANGVTGEIVVAGKLGDFTLPPLHPLLDTVELDGDAAIGRRTISLESDPWMADHAIDGVPVLPGVMGIELMVATALAASPLGHYRGCEDVAFEAPLKLHRDEPVVIEVRAEPEADGAVRCKLSSTRRARTGREIRTDHFSARVQLEEMPLLPALRSGYFPEERISRRDIYKRFFHGQSFQVLRSAEAVAVQGLLAEATVEHAPIAEGLLTDPLVLEAAFQAAGLHRMALEGQLALPASIDAVEHEQAAAEGETLQVMVQRRDDAYDIDVDGQNGRILRVRGFRMVVKGPLPPGDRIPEPEGGWPSATLATSSEAKVELPPAEARDMTARGTERRQRDRLAGQLAARRAVAALVGHDDFRVARRDTGEPYVDGVDGIAVSISHQDGEAVAFAVRGARAGIDVETPSERSAAFAEDWFRPEERRLDLTAAWAVKEAVLKALGLGMKLSPRDVLVRSTERGEVRVRLFGDAARRHAELGGGRLRVRIGEIGGRVVATAVLAA
ncbi:MAG: SDR family NAD(P)-dependent oxidoreductase [Myxococcota bacterium]